MTEKGKEEEVEVKKSREKKVEENKEELEGKIEYVNSEKTSDNKVEKIKTEANTESRGKNIIHHHRKKYGNFNSISYNFWTSPSPRPIVQSQVPTKPSPRFQKIWSNSGQAKRSSQSKKNL